jgi:bifunctional non-homologous end joining protein LigD
MDKLKKYKQKREFKKTSEHGGKTSKKKISKLIFVVQEHWASHHHFDFRLEMNGVLQSWAVPKTIPIKPNIKRLAIQVEDHHYEYKDFQGTIPEGQYGAGKVKIWDKGTYELTEKTKNKLVFNLKGKKLKGEYSLILFKPPKNWLLMKNKK